MVFGCVLMTLNWMSLFSRYMFVEDQDIFFDWRLTDTQLRALSSPTQFDQLIYFASGTLVLLGIFVLFANILISFSSKFKN